MDAAEVLAELFRVTGALDPVAPATHEDLGELRRRLAHSLLDLPSTGVATWVPHTEEYQGIVETLVAIVEQVITERADGTGPPRSRVFRRELPGRSAYQVRSFPARSGGHHIARSFGPMLDAKERYVYFDLIEATDFVRVERFEFEPFLHMPADAVSDDGRTYTFGRGSIWIEATRLVGGTPGWVGLRVESGTITFDHSPVRHGNRLVSDPFVRSVLKVRLDAIDAVPPGAGPGQDGGHASAARPTTAEFHFGITGAYLIRAGGGSLTAYGSTVTMSRSEEQDPWRPWPTDAILVPYQPDQAELTPVDVRSNLLRPTGTWHITAAGWLLPTSLVTDPDELGEAADAGAMALVFDKGLDATWPGLEAGRYTASQAVLAVDSQELAMACYGSTPPIAHQKLALWHDTAIELRYKRRFQLQYVSSRAGVDILAVRATIDEYLDELRRADGTPAHIEFPEALVCFSDTGTGTWIHLLGQRESTTKKLAPLALQNALLLTTSVTDLNAVGMLADRAHVVNATLRLTHGLHGIIPFLPDPYAANFDPMPRPDLPSGGRLTAVFTWAGSASRPVPALLMTGVTPDEEALLDLLPTGRALFPDNEVDNVLQQRFDQPLPVRDPQPPLVLLDVSGKADQWGLGTAFEAVRRDRPPVSVSTTTLVADISELRAVALPQVSWEPVRTHPDDLEPGFPNPLISRDDGGPLVLGVAADSVHLSQIAPEPLLESLVSLARRDTAVAAIRFTLPFGIKAVASIPVSDAGQSPSERPELAIIAPPFGPYTGGLQLSVRAATRDGLPGVAVQTQHSVDGSHNVLGGVVAGFFNATFNTMDDSVKHVPLTRIDFSGYGASTFSSWVNDNPNPVDVTKVEFGVMTGRAHCEVVEIQSILWPCMAKVVRRITIRREGHGAVIRRDSGWVAATPGLFHRPDSDCMFHPGVVRGMYQIRQIRETSRRVTIGSAVELQAVYFDTDIGFENVDRGHGAEGSGPHDQPIGLVPSQRQLGFVQLINPSSTQKTPLGSTQLAALLTEHGPVGGPVDCELHIGDSQQRIRVANVQAAVAKSPSGSAEFALAVYGAPTLPREGQWSVVRTRNLPADSPEPEPIDARLGVPLVRAGNTQLSPEANLHPYRFADPADLLTPSQPAADYALLLSTQTFRVLFPRVKIDKGASSITSDVAPLLADPHAMLNATGLFPRLAHAITFPSNSYQLQVLDGGGLRLSPSPLTQTVPARRLEIVKAAGVHAYTEYQGGSDDKHQKGPATAALRFDSSAQPSWDLTIGPMSTVTEIEPFGPLMRMITTLEANSAGHPRAARPLIEFGGALRPVEQLLWWMAEFGLPIALVVDTLFNDDYERTPKLTASLHAPEFGWPPPGKPVSAPGKLKGSISVGYEIGKVKAEGTLVPYSMELWVEIEGSLQVEILPKIFAGGMLRLKYAAGHDPSENEPVIHQMQLAAAAVGTVGGTIIPDLVKVEGEVRYGYVLLADIAERKYYPGFLFGFALECEFAKVLKGVCVTVEGEVVGYIQRFGDEIVVRAETTIAGEVELCDLLSIEFSVEIEYEARIPSKVLGGLAAAAYFGFLPPIPP
ncbi:hypothetical protein [Nonomuraea sp. LPB2021202275-12-8]|uniref:hypothetical protein n=1 Tax=Nonomuraea sp. LPB2021202275-12-8 TaxID=3120159 RepID=UPI00300DBC5B